METGVPRVDYEQPHHLPDGRQGWLRTSKVPLFDVNGQVSGILGTYEDITDRKQAEAAYAEASNLLEMMLENAPDYIYFKDQQSRFVRSSKSLARIFRAPNEKFLIGKTDFDFFLEEHARQAFEDEQQIIRTGQPLVSKPEKETHADGRTTWALTTKLPWFDKDGKIVGTFGISKDVTAIKEAEMKLEYERQLFHALVDQFPDNIYFKDRESRFMRLSRSKVEKSRSILLARYRDQHPDEDTSNYPLYLTDPEKFAHWVMGKTDFDVSPEAAARVSYEDEQRIIATGQPIIAKLEQHPGSGGNKTTWILATKLPWRDQNGNIIGTFGVSRDVTAIKEAEAQLESAHQRLVETSRLAGMAEVATDVLHNVGNVLNSVNVSCSLTIDRLRSSKMASLGKVSALLQENRANLAQFLTVDSRGQQIPDYLKALATHLSEDQTTLLKELEQLLRHVDHIKQIVAMQQSYAKVAGVKETVSPMQLIEDALHINAAALTRHDVHVAKEFENVPPIMTEKHKVLQILVNLIRNAKYALDDSKRSDKLLTLKVSPEGSDQLKIQVVDNGIGIPPENLTRIFGHGFTTRRNGHGFGLHSSALAVRELGGSLLAESDGEGKGAKFTLLLPYKASQPEPEK
jgi:PAS domain S-box-containing protein